MPQAYSLNEPGLSDSSSQAFVSVCIPVYNRKEQVVDAIRSALAQDVTGLEVVVVDNHSDDGTWEVLQTLDDPRLRTYRNETNVGMFGNFNRAGELARGEYIVFLCSDDRLCPCFLSHAIGLLRRHPQAAMVSSKGRHVSKDGTVLGFRDIFFPPGEISSDTARSAFFWCAGSFGVNIFNFPGGIVVRRAVLKKAGLFSSDLGDPADVDMWLRCLDHGTLLVADFVGCEATLHQSQQGNRTYELGEHIKSLADLAKVHLQGEQNRHIRDRLSHMLGGEALLWTVLSKLRGRKESGRSLAIARELGQHWWGMTLAAAKLRTFRLLEKRVGLSKYKLYQLSSASRFQKNNRRYK